MIFKGVADVNNADRLDKAKAIRMIKNILKLEQENLKTRKYNKDEMIEKIKDIIEEEVRKCY